MRGQADIFGEIIVDNFAGGGGASTGESARMVLDNICDDGRADAGCGAVILRKGDHL